MPANPNTHYTTYLYATGASGTANTATTNGNTKLRLFDDTTARSTIGITGSGTVGVTSDANGVITIAGAGPSVTDNNPTLDWDDTYVVGSIDSTELHVTMPSNPNTHYTSNLITNSSATGTSNATGGSNSVYLNLIENGGVRNAHQIIGSGTVTVDSDTAGKITITGASPNVTDNNPTLA